MIPLDQPQQLSPRAQALWVIKGIYFVIFAVVVFYLGFLAITGTIQFYSWVALAVAFGALLVNIAVAMLAYSRFSYTFRASGLEIESGIIFKRRVLIPYQSIQRTESFQDIFERILGVCDIFIEVAAPMHGGAEDVADVVAPVALRRGTITRLAGVARADADAVLQSLAEHTSRCRV